MENKVPTQNNIPVEGDLDEVVSNDTVKDDKNESNADEKKVDGVVEEIDLDALHDVLEANRQVYEKDTNVVTSNGFKLSDESKGVFRIPPLNVINSNVEDALKKVIDLNNKDNLTKEEFIQLMSLANALKHSAPDLFSRSGIDYDTLNKRINPDWRNGILNKEGNKLVTITSPKLGNISGDTKLTGIRAVDVASELAGLGRRRKVVLPHTGIWVSLVTPLISSYVELHQVISQEKIDLGRKTRGAIFSNESSYLTDKLTNYIVKHIHDTNAPHRTPEYLKSIIREPDLISLLWGLMCTHWTNGYRYTHSCTASKDCDYTETAILDVSRIYWVDNNRLNDFHRDIVFSNPNRKRTEEEIAEYQEKFNLPDSKRVEIPFVQNEHLNVKTYINFRVPTIQEDIDSGMEWVGSLERISIDAFVHSPLHGNERNIYINQQAEATELLKYSHWIDSIEIEDEDNNVSVIRDTDKIEVLKRYSSDKSLRNYIIEKTHHFISDVTVAVVGFPNFPCPKCGKAANTEKSPNQLIAPIDVLSAFFTQCQEFLISEGFLKINTTQTNS